MPLTLLHTLLPVFQSQRALVLENLALRHQLNVLQRPAKRPHPRAAYRALWVLLARFWSGWRGSPIVAQPETVIRWHREGPRLYSSWKCRSKWSGRPRVPKEVRKLIRQMPETNALWGAPRVHGELLKLGIEISQAAVSKYMECH